MSTPWEPETFELSDEPTDQDLRKAFRILLAGGAISGDARWSIACVRVLNDLGPDSAGGSEAAEAYTRAAALAPPKARPSGVLGKAGRRRRRMVPIDTAAPVGAAGELTPPELRKLKEHEARTAPQSHGWSANGFGGRVYQSVSGLRWTCCGHFFEDEHSSWCRASDWKDPFPG